MIVKKKVKKIPLYEYTRVSTLYLTKQYIYLIKKTCKNAIKNAFMI